MDAGKHAVSTAARSGNRSVPALVFGALSALSWLTSVAALMLMGPRFTEIFTDFGVALPSLTLRLIQLSEARWALLALTLVLTGVSAPVATRSRCGWAVARFALGTISLGVLVAAMYAPLSAMITSLDGGA